MGTESTSSAIIAATVASSAVLAYFILRKPMSTKEKAIAAAGDAILPSGFITSSLTNKRSQSIYTIHLPRTDAAKPAKGMLFLAHGVGEHCKIRGLALTFDM